MQSALVLPVLALIRQAFDSAIPHRNVGALVRIGAAIILLRALGSVVALGLRSHVLHTIKGAVADLRRDLIARVYGLSREYFGHADLSVLQTRIVQDSERVDNLSNTLFSGMLPAAFSAVVLLIVLLALNWRLLLLGGAVLPLLWISARFSGWFVKRQVFTFQRAFEGFSRGVHFAVRQIDLTRMKAFEAEEMERQQRHIGDLRTTGHRMAMSYAVHGQVQRTLMGITGILILIVGGAAIARGTMTLGSFVAFYVAAGMLNGFVDTLMTGIPDLLAGNESLVTLHRLVTEGAPEPYQGQQSIDFDGTIEFRDVWFGYGEEPVLRGVNLLLRTGANVALVGPNGAGKSTLMHLLLGFYRPGKGQLLASGVPYDEVAMRLVRRAIGVVPQHPAFFAGTVFENIAYGSPEATLEEVAAAAHVALADEVVATLPKGYETEIGEGGALLSGGEGQRLAIARALLGRPRILILDEPTNHLDVSAIERLMRRLVEWPDRPTLVVVSHDPKVVDYANEVYRLHGGQLVPEDRHARAAAPAP